MILKASYRWPWPAALVAVSLCVSAAFAEWPATRPASSHWAFVRPQRPELPAVKNASWCRNPIDRFALARLEAQGLHPSPEACRETLLRRVSLDLTGLPPTPKEMDDFLADQSADAYEKVVERLLASPHYGERWGKHWLDAARYADSNGYSIDAPRVMWKYRDWVIDATNKDMPFDQFTIEQIAGDMLPNATIDQKIATGFHRNTQINQEGGIDLEQFRVEGIIDRVSTTGSVWLGLTIGCAQCHNHKFDPLSQKDYYSFFAFFNQCDEPELKTPTAADLARQAEIRAKRLALEAQKKAGTSKSNATLEEWEKGLTEEEKSKLPLDIQNFIKLGDARNKVQLTALVKFYKADSRARNIDTRIAGLKKQEAAAVTTALIVAQRPSPRETFIFIKGDFTRHSDVVTPAVPAMLPQITTPNPTRLDLARWLTDPRNPMTARVTVNRIWQHYFGLGLVETENDFGTQGTPPSNPQLLDWLATEFVNPSIPQNLKSEISDSSHGSTAIPWSRKAMHRLIVTSATYRQSSSARPELADLDPYNRQLARQSRVRLDAEIVRDAELEASGLLSDTIGGPSVFPPQPEGVMGLGQVKRVWKTSTGADAHRRGLYTFLWRSTPHPLLTSFDATNATASCTRRLRSNTPLQALILMNDEASLECARAMSARVLREGPGDDAGRLDYAFRLCTSRHATADERAVLLRLLKKQLEVFAADKKDAESLAWSERPPGANARTLAAWTIVSRAILNLDETITRE
jgi:hypothetical protein